MGVKVYLAGRYSRRLELCGYRQELVDAGYEVTSRWLNGNHEIDTDTQGLSIQAAASERERFAKEDWADVMAADICVSFTESPRSTNSRGGRHVEFGASLGAGRRCIVVGYRENVFHHLPAVEFFGSWVDARRELLSSIDRGRLT